MKIIFTITISLIVIIVLIIVGSIGKIEDSIKCLDAIEQNPGPPSPDYYSAYKWVKCDGDWDIRRAYFKSKDTLRNKSRDFRDTIQNIFADSIAMPIKKAMWAKMDPEEESVVSTMDLLQLFHKPFHDFLNDPKAIAEDILTGRLQISQLDKKKHDYLFDFLAKSNTLQNTCAEWSTFLEFYAKEEKDSSALNCCKYILKKELKAAQK